MDKIVGRKEALECPYEISAARYIRANHIPTRIRVEVDEWLRENIDGEFCYIKDLGTLLAIAFEREEDLILFKLAWY